MISKCLLLLSTVATSSSLSKYQSDTYYEIPERRLISKTLFVRKPPPVLTFVSFMLFLIHSHVASEGEPVGE